MIELRNRATLRAFLAPAMQIYGTSCSRIGSFSHIRCSPLFFVVAQHPPALGTRFSSLAHRPLESSSPRGLIRLAVGAVVPALCCGAIGQLRQAHFFVWPLAPNALRHLGLWNKSVVRHGKAVYFSCRKSDYAGLRCCWLGGSPITFPRSPYYSALWSQSYSTHCARTCARACTRTLLLPLCPEPKPVSGTFASRT